MTEKSQRILIISLSILSMVGIAVGFSFLIRKGKLDNIMKHILSKEQDDVISKLHKNVQNVFRKFISDVEKTGYKVIITSGYRSLDKQKELDSINPNNAAAGLSYHNYGMAIDINLLKNGKYLRKSSTTKDWEDTGVPKIAKNLGLTWGGDFKNYHDPIHFDARNIVGKTTTELSLINTKQFGDNFKGNEIVI